MRKSRVAITILLCTFLCAGLCACGDITIGGSNGKTHNSVFGGLGGYNYDDAGYMTGNAEISDSIDSLSIDWAAGNVNISYHDENTVIISEECGEVLGDGEKMRYCVDAGKLIIKFCAPGAVTFNLEKNLEVTLPKGTNLEFFDYDVASATLTCDELYAGNVDCDMASGSVTFGRLIATGNVNNDAASGSFTVNNEFKANSVDSDTASGQFIINNAEVTNGIKIDTASGDATIGLAKMCNVDFDSASGSINLKVPKDASFTAEMDSASGDLNIDMNAKVQGDAIVVGDGQYVVEADTASGDMIITN